MKRVIFLDLDGVVILNGVVSQIALNNLYGFCSAEGIGIVISSDLRNMNNKDEIISILDHPLTDLFHKDWFTPIVGHRHNEIARWLEMHQEITHYAILDDFVYHFEGAVAELLDRLIVINASYGIGERDIKKLKRHFENRTGLSDVDKINLTELARIHTSKERPDLNTMGAINQILDGL